MEVKKTEKANLDRSSLLFFLIGLNIVLIGILGFFNWKKYDYVPPQKEEVVELRPAEDVLLIDIPEPETPPPPPEPNEPPPPPPELDVVDIEEVEEPVEPPKLKEQKIEPPKITPQRTSTGPVKKVNLDALRKKTNKSNEERVEAPVTVNRVAEMAIYPGCEKFKGNKRKLIGCFQQEISKDILRYLDTEFPDVDKQSVAVRLKFHVTPKGYISDIDPEMGDEAFKPQAKRALEKAADYLKRKNELIQPAKMADGSKATLIFNIPVKLNNPNY